MVILECDTCDGPRRKGITIAWPNDAINFAGFDGGMKRFKIPLKEGKGWLKDSQNTLQPWTPATKCDLIQVLSRLSVSSLGLTCKVDELYVILV